MKKMFKKHRKLCFTAGIILIVVLIAGVQFMRVRSRMAERMNVPQWETATLERRTLLDSISATGTITSIANKDVTANVTGVYVESVEVSVGDRVQEGDLLCVLNAETIEQNLADAKASYDVAKKKTQIELASAQRSLTETQTGNAINAERAQDNVSDAYNDYLETVTDIEEAESKWDQALETEYEKKGEYEYRQELLATKKEEMETAHKEVLDSQLSVLKSLQSQYKKALADDQAYAEAQSACQALEQEVSSWKAKYDAAAQSTKSAQTAYEQALKTSESSKDSYEKQVENKEDTERSNASTLASKTDSLTTTQLNASIQGLSDEQKIAEYEKQIEACQVKAPFYIEVLMQDGKVSDTEPADLQNADKVFDKNRLPQEGMELPQRENDQEMPLQNTSLNPDRNGTMNQNTKQITVTKGVESDYYVEIAGEGLTEGMTVIIPQTQAEQMDMQNRMMMRGPMGGF